ncbi:peroxisome biogenesis protein 3-1-like [Punica granatum]|uniref:Peroxisome biogenesis protein 3-1-like n=2 Tax=Punica granatum TaxID=22663 RepID=A0A6P8EN68_PUNGR|nr:peroxisome biogenesis protein 3-1-like [Punica granatum]
MLSLRDFWRRHRRKVFVSAGVLGTGYLLYKLYDAHNKRLADLEKELANERENDELLKAHMQAHFENIQRIADASTLPHAMHYLSCRVAEGLDLSHLMERLMKGRGQPNTLSQAEKLELWDKLKILSFTRMVLSLWAMTVLSLYIRVQVNILGRHLYIDTARGLGSSQLEDSNLIDMEDQEKFLASADFLSNQGLPALISNMQAAATEVLKGKQLRDNFSSITLRETIMQIMDTFMSMGSPHHWVDYMMHQDAKSCSPASPSSTDGSILPSATKFDQLMMEARMVLSSEEFRSVVDTSFNIVANALVEDFEVQNAENPGTPLAKLLPRVAQVGPLLLEEPNKNRFIQIIRNAPEVEVFFTLLYANMPSS